jgi:TRAP-type C4-dicarboxylate transport system substrate-binding protein
MWTIGGAAALALGMAALLPGTATAQTTWTLYTYAPAATIAPAKGMARIAEAVEKETGGQLVIKWHIAGSLPISSTDITQAVSDNVVQMGDDGFFQGHVPITGIMRLPLLINTPEEFEKAAAVMRPYFEKAYDKKGIAVLGTYYFPLQVAWSRKPLRSLEDMKRQKMRVTSAEQGEFVKRFGGSPLTLGGSEVPSALDRGVVDGVFTASAGGGKIWKDMLKYTYRLGPNYFDGVIIVNKEAFAKLTPDTQAKLRRIVDEVAPWITAELKKDEIEVTAQLQAAGIVVTEASKADIEQGPKVMAGYWDEWAKSRGPEAAEALQKVRAALGR